MDRCRMLIVLAVVAALLVVAFAPPPARAANTVDEVTLAGLPPVAFATDAATGAVVRVDSNTITGKRSLLVKLVVNSQDVYLNLRLQRASNGFFIDAIAAESSTALASRMSSLDLSSNGTSHPAPTADATDDALRTGMAGWNGY